MLVYRLSEHRQFLQISARTDIYMFRPLLLAGHPGHESNADRSGVVQCFAQSHFFLAHSALRDACASMAACTLGHYGRGGGHNQCVRATRNARYGSRLRDFPEAEPALRVRLARWRRCLDQKSVNREKSASSIGALFENSHK
jgi:hypothetical protein